MTTFLLYAQLTISQAEQVQRDFVAVRNGDPWLYEYEVNSAGRVVDVYRVVKTVFVEGVRA